MFFKPFYMVFFVGLMSVFVYVYSGFSFHYPKKVVDIASEEYNRNPRRDECLVDKGMVPECIYGSGPVGAIVLGDSHAQSLVRSVERAISDNRSVLDWTRSACNTIEGIVDLRKGYSPYECGAFVSYALEEIKQYPGMPLIIANRFSMLLHGESSSNNERPSRATKILPGMSSTQLRTNEYRTEMVGAFVKTICDLSVNNPVYLVGQVPEFTDSVPRKMAKEYMLGNTGYRVSIPFGDYEERHMEFSEVAVYLKKECGVQIVDVESIFCDKKYCYGDISGRPAYFDGNHLSEFGASQLIPFFRKALRVKSKSYEDVSDLSGTNE